MVTFFIHQVQNLINVKEKRDLRIPVGASKILVLFLSSRAPLGSILYSLETSFNYICEFIIMGI